MRTCTKCNEAHHTGDFQIIKGKPVGWCRPCRTAAEKERRGKVGIKVKNISRIEGNKKLCLECWLLKGLDEFSPSARGLGGVSSYCKGCQTVKFRNRERSRLATAKYRVVNRERHLTAHRIRMFERRTLKTVTQDGSVTDSFLKELYNESVCYYCTKETPVELRTADHKVPLIKGGTHTAGNLVMACWTCNCSKRDLSEIDFFERQKNGKAGSSSQGRQHVS